MMRENINDFHCILLTTHCCDRMAKNDFFLSVVHSRIELKLCEFLRIVDCPTAESSGHADHIALRVPSINTEGVQFEQFATIVLIKAGPPYSRRNRNVIARNLRLPVVQIVEHCGVAGRRKQHVSEVSKDIRTDGISLKTRKQNSVRTFPVEHIKVIHPKVDQHFFELTIRINRAIKLVLDQLRVHEFLRLPGRQSFTTQMWNVC